MVLAQVHAGSLPEETVVELLLVLLSVVRRIPNRLTIFLLSVAAPHTIDWGFAGQEVVTLLFQHLGVADVDTWVAEQG